MRQCTAQATFAVFVATALHAIAVGNMLPAFVDAPTPDELRPLTTICVDQTEFVVNKLRDRGTHQAYGVVTNAQDLDRKSTRLNSSHSQISYAVFCLKKKNAKNSTISML